MDTSELLAFQLATQSDHGFTAEEAHFPTTVVGWLQKCDDDTFVQFLHFMLWLESENGTRYSGVAVVEEVLSSAGSKWAAANVGGRSVLVERVPEGVLNSVTEALSGTDAASKKLQEAWFDAFGTKPRPSVAYYTAVVAVENAALAVIPVNHPEPQLSMLFSILEADNPKWQLTLRDSEKAPGAKSLAAMLRTLFRGHDSRHGSPDDYKDVGIEQARAAVMLAATLVWWFRSGVVVPVTTDGAATSQA